MAKEHPQDVALRAKAEKYAKIIGKTLIYADGDASAYGQNAFFYDAAEGVLVSLILLIAEFAPKISGTLFRCSSWYRTCRRRAVSKVRISFSS